MKTVLLIDDNEDYRETILCILEDDGFEVLDSDCPDSAFQLLDGLDPPDLIVCDLHMPFTSGSQRGDFEESLKVGIMTVNELAWVYPTTPVVAMTASDEADLPELKRTLAPVPLHAKPARLADLLDVVHGYLACQEMGGMN